MHASQEMPFSVLRLFESSPTTCNNSKQMYRLSDTKTETSAGHVTEPHAWFSPAASEEVLFELIKSKCIPILLYCTDVCPMNSADRHSLQFTINKIVYKIFGAMSKDLLTQYFTLWGISLFWHGCGLTTMSDSFGRDHFLTALGCG